MVAYYNENDPYAAQWLRNLIANGLIATGDVDERSIVDVRSDELRGFDQCHFFAGIGGWSLALRLAGWPDDKPVWTGSCPCQSFSAAGKRKGFEDKRHLWPVWFNLIREFAPPVVFGEQVEGAVKHGWLDLVASDLEGTGYAVGAAVLGAHSGGAPHKRQRLYFVAQRLADAEIKRREWIDGGAKQAGRPGAAFDSTACCVADADGRHAGPEGLQRSGEHGRKPQDGISVRGGHQGKRCEARSELAWPDALDGFWRDADWLGCRDGKWRPVESGSFPLAHGVSGRVAVVRPGIEARSPVQAQNIRWVNRLGSLKGFGNAIVPQVAAEFIKAAGET